MSWFQKKPSEPAVTQPSPAPGAQTVKIAPLLDATGILFPGPESEKAVVLDTLVRMVCSRAGIADPAPALAKVLERERGISTTLDTGLSLPHARLDDLNGIYAGMAVLRKPLAETGQADIPVRLIFLFLSPNKPTSFSQHLQLLRGVASLFQPAIIDELVASKGPEAALGLIRQREG